MSLPEKRDIYEHAYRDNETHVNNETSNTNANMEITEKRKGWTLTAKGVLSLAFVLMIALFWWGCEGPMGPAGQGIEDLDLVSPTVNLIDPKFGDQLKSNDVYVDSFEIMAEADDNSSVEYVEFYFDGSSKMGLQSAVDSTAPYLWTWFLDSSGHAHGVYPLMARAFDGAGNSGDSPTILIRYTNPPEIDTLSEFGSDPTRSVLTMPDYYKDRYWNVRLSPAQSCRLLAVHFEFIQPTFETMTGTSNQLVGGSDFYVYAWATDDNIQYPEIPPLDSVLVAEEDAVYSDQINVQWTVVSVSDWNLEFDEQFHVGFSVPDYDNMRAQNRAMPIVTTVNDTLVDGSQHTSIEYASDEFGAAGGWGTLQNNWPRPGRLDLRIRAEVEYQDGSHAMLHPDGTSTPIQHR